MNERSAVNGIIWCQSLSKGTEQLNKIIQSYKDCSYEITKQINSKSCKTVCFSNGDRWQIKIASDNALGYRCNVSYIDECIDHGIIRNIITPCTTRSPFQAYHYY